MTEQDQPIRVLLVEDHEHVLWGLKKLIEGEWPRMKVAAAAKSVAQALAALHEAPADVVVLDLFLGKENSLDHFPSLAAGGAAIVVLTGCRDISLHRRAIDAGARTVVIKEEPAEMLLREIERANAWAPRHRRARQQDCQSAVGTGSAGNVSSTTRR